MKERIEKRLGVTFGDFEIEYLPRPLGMHTNGPANFSAVVYLDGLAASSSPQHRPHEAVERALLMLIESGAEEIDGASVYLRVRP